MGRTSDARERLISSAAELWHARSYAGVGVSEICEAAGVQKGSFYHFFGSKRNLALAVIDDFWGRYSAQFLSRSSRPGGPPLERITDLVARQIALLAPMQEREGCLRGCPFGGLAMEMSTQDEVLRQRLDRVFDDWAGFFETALAEAVAAKDIPPVDVRKVARAMQAYLQGVFLLAKTKNDIAVIRDLGPQVVLLAGVAPQAAPRKRRAA